VEVIIPDTNMTAIMPQIILSIGAFLVLLLGVFAHSMRKWIGYISFFTCLIALINVFTLWDTNVSAFSGMITVNYFTNAFSAIILVSSALIFLVTNADVDEHKIGEFYSIALMSTTGMLIMASSLNLMVIFLGLEIMSIGLYVMISMNRARIRALEAGLKYFLLGAFSSGFFLYGISLTYGATGSFDLAQIAQYLQKNNLLGDPLMMVGLGLLLIGFGFKVALVPFHMWIPDVYQGSPAPITAFIATGPKAAAFAAFARVFIDTMGELHIDWSSILFWICIFSMIGGNFMALIQKDIKRMLAFSSIAHAGYIIMAILAGPMLLKTDPSAAPSSIVFYVMVYALTNITAFTIIYVFESREGKNLNVDDFAGFGFRYPMLSVAMSIAMLSMAGFPLTGGFIGKLQVFSAAVDAGYIVLTVIAIAASVVSVYYYLGVMVRMYFTEAERELEDVPISRSTWFTILATSASLIILGIIPSLPADAARGLFHLIM
jgi:NADH-quinone oxidoreductase subunit N